MYKYNKNGYMDGTKTFYDVGGIYEGIALTSPDELKHCCERCLELTATWKYDKNWLKNPEKEYIVDHKISESVVECNEKYQKIGKILCYALIEIKIKNIDKNQYAIVRKNLIIDNGENEKNFGFVALVSLHENKIIEYGNEKYNNGSPVLRIIEFEDTYLYHIVRTFQLDINIDKLFHSINLDPWNGNKYDVYYYNSYNFINIYLKKYNQRLILMKNDKIFDTAYKHLCRECYKKFNNPECYIGPNTSHLETYSKKNEKNDKIWWCWECGKNATFHYVGRPLNITYKYLCRVCYFELAEPKNYIKYKSPFNNIPSYGILGGIMGMMAPIMMAPITRNEICYKCLKFPASYKSIK